MSQRRILHLVHQYAPEYIGGTELYTAQLAYAQAALGHVVGVFYRRSGAQHGVTERRDGTEAAPVTVYAAHHGGLSPQIRFQSTFGDGPLLTHWAATLDKFQPDVVHVQHLMGLPAGCLTLLRDRAIPYIVTLHDYWWVCANAQLLTNYDETVCDGPKRYVNCGRCALARAGRDSRLLAPAVAPLLGWRARQLLPLLEAAEAVIAPTEFVRDTYRKLGVGLPQAVVIGHGIELPTPLPERVEPAGLQLLYAGGITPQKGVHVLLDALAQLGDPTVHLTVYGSLKADPTYVNLLRQHSGAAHVTFAGRLPHTELWQKLASASLVVIPTLWYETASLLVQEAFAVGVPVVASDIGVLPERVRDRVDGWLVPAGDATAWAQALAALRDNPAERQRLANNIQPVLTMAAHTQQVMARYPVDVQ